MKHDLVDVNKNLDICSKSILPIYDIFEIKIFQKLDYAYLDRLAQIWMMDAGNSAECSWPKEYFEKYRTFYNSKFVNKLLYFYDINHLLGAISDRFSMVEGVISEIYQHLTYPVEENAQYVRAIRNSDLNVASITAELYAIYIYLCSAMDLITKVIYELDNIDKISYKTYPKMKSENILWKKSYSFVNRFSGDNIFNPTDSLLEIQDLRNQIIHNGGFDYRLWIYDCFTKDGRMDKVIFLPDVDNGHIIKSTNRKNFYSQGRTANQCLIYQVYDFCYIFNETVKQIYKLYNTNKISDVLFTERYLSYISFKMRHIPKEKYDSFFNEIAKIKK